MKKILLMMLAVMATLTATATESKDYPDNLIVTINGESTDPIPATVTVEYIDETHINFKLVNFCLGEDIPVGNIEVENLELTAGPGYKTFSRKEDIYITEGDLDGVDTWLGPMISPVPIDLNGKISNKKLYVTIDIDMSDMLGQIIYVTFGTDIPAVVSSKSYPDNLVVTINGESTDPIPATVTVETLENGNINFVLNNFCLGEDIPVGTIELDNLELTVSANGYKTFSRKEDIYIDEGDLDGVDTWLGPMISPVPIDMNGKITDNKLYVTIDIDMSDMLGQIIYVAFGSDITDGIMSISDKKSEGKMYDLNGRRISKATKGLYIVNGKKVVINK